MIQYYTWLGSGRCSAPFRICDSESLCSDTACGILAMHMWKFSHEVDAVVVAGWELKRFANIWFCYADDGVS